MDEYIKLLMPIITLVLGTVLGYVTNMIIRNITKKDTITNKLFDQFIITKNEICEVLSNLANLKTISEIKNNDIDKIRNTVSCLYFKHYDLLPKTVLLELQCLFFCLSDKNNNLYIISDDLNINVISKENELESFLTQISMIPNFKYIAYYQIMNEDMNVKRAASINFQARKVLKEINNYFNLEYFMKIDKNLKKC